MQLHTKGARSMPHPSASMSSAEKEAGLNTLCLKALSCKFRQWSDYKYDVFFQNKNDVVSVTWETRDNDFGNERGGDIVKVKFYPVTYKKNPEAKMYIMDLWYMNPKTHTPKLIQNALLRYDSCTTKIDEILYYLGVDSKRLRFPKQDVDESFENNLWFSKLGWHTVRNQDGSLEASKWIQQNVHSKRTAGKLPGSQEMTISSPLHGGFHFDGLTLHQFVPVITKIQNHFKCSYGDACKNYNKCMNHFALDPNKYKNMNGEDLMKQCFEFISTLHTGNSDDEDLPAPRRIHVLHQISPPQSGMYERYHVHY